MRGVDRSLRKIFGKTLKPYYTDVIGITGRELNTRLGHSHDWVSSVVNGNHWPSPEVIDRIIELAPDGKDAESARLKSRHQQLSAIFEAKGGDPQRRRRALTVMVRTVDALEAATKPTYSDRKLPSPPNKTVLIEGQEACDQLVIDMFRWASWAVERNSEPLDPGRIFINCAAVDQLSSRGSKDTYQAVFQTVLREALTAGWEVIHLIREDITHDDEDEVVAQVVALLMGSLNTGAAYVPKTVSNERRFGYLSETILVENFGAARWIGPTTMFFLPWDDTFHTDLDWEGNPFPPSPEPYRGSEEEKVGDLLLRVAKKLDKESPDLVEVHEARSEPASGRALPPPTPKLLAFDAAFTNAETISRGTRLLMKPAPSLSTMPRAQSIKQFEHWRAKAGGRRRDYDRLLHTREQRRAAIEAHDGKRDYRDIGTFESYEAYLKTGLVGRSTSSLLKSQLPLYAGTELEIEDRIKHFEAIIHLITSSKHHYQLALPYEADEWVFTVHDIYWGATIPEGEEALAAQVFFFSTDQRGRALAGEISNPTLASDMQSLFNMVWEELQVDADPDVVAGRLQQMVDAARAAPPADT